MAKVQAVVPGPVQCKGFANTLHGLLLNVFEGFLLEYSTFSDCMPGCCAVLIALNVISFCLKITLFVVVSLVVMLCRWCLLPPCRGFFEPVGCREDGIGICDGITGTFYLYKPQPILLNLLLSCVWQVCTQIDYDLCLSTSSLGSENQGNSLCWGCTSFEVSQFLVLTNNHDGFLFFCFFSSTSFT